MFFDRYPPSVYRRLSGNGTVKVTFLSQQRYHTPCNSNYRWKDTIYVGRVRLRDYVGKYFRTDEERESYLAYRKMRQCWGD